MLQNSEAVKSNIAGLVDAFGYLAKDYSHPDGFNKINELVNKLTRDK